MPFGFDPEVLDVDARLAAATRAAIIVGWLAVGLTAAYLMGLLTGWVFHRMARRRRMSGFAEDLAHFSRWPYRVGLMLVATDIVLSATIGTSATWAGWLDHLLRIAIIAVVAWLAASLVRVIECRVVARFVGDDEVSAGDRRRRRIRTQAMTLRRLIVAVIVVLGVAVIAMTFPSFRQLGTTLFASAGVLSVVAGLAAQTSLGSVFAGMQISFSDAVRVGDVVVIEDEFGRIEEITLTYVVVKIWDQRRLVLPTTYFTTTPFENWTRNAPELFGTVLLDVDYTAPVDGLRAELDRLLAASEIWDGRTGSLVVFDAVDGCLRLRATVSAANSSDLFTLRCNVREGLVGWLQRHAPEAFPRRRLATPQDSALDASGGPR